VGQHALGGGQAIQDLTRLHHLRGWQDVAGLREGRDAADHRHRGIAVQKDLLDEVLQIEVVHGAAVFLEIGIPAAAARAQVEQVGEVLGRVHVVNLDVEDELPAGRALGEGGRLEGLHGIDVEESPEHCVHGQEGRGQARPRAEELSPRQAQRAGVLTRRLREERRDARLLGRPGQRRVLLVGDDLGRDGRPAIGARVLVPLPLPALAHG
jgi:hypothetical protein